MLELFFNKMFKMCEDKRLFVNNNIKCICIMNLEMYLYNEFRNVFV